MAELTGYSDDLNDCQKSLIRNVEACANPTDDDDEPEDLAEHYTNPENILDIEYRLDAQNRLKSVELTLTWGGPNIYLDTAACEIKGYHGDTYTAVLDKYDCDKIAEYYEELHSCF